MIIQTILGPTKVILLYHISLIIWYECTLWRLYNLFGNYGHLLYVQNFMNYMTTVTTTTGL